MPDRSPFTQPPDGSGGPSKGSDETSGRETSGRRRRSEASAVSWVRFSGAGVELALITVAFGALGAFADRWLNLQRPVLSALAGLVGFTLGMVRFIRLALAASETGRVDREGDADSPRDS